MSRLRSAGQGDAHGFPRVSGDEPAGKYVDILAGKFSPRERG